MLGLLSKVCHKFLKLKRIVNVFSNHRNYPSKIPFDFGVAIEEQLENAYLQKIDVMFVTNHNTLDGYSQMLECKQNHAKYQNIRIYPAEEITINK